MNKFFIFLALKIFSDEESQFESEISHDNNMLAIEKKMINCKILILNYFDSEKNLISQQIANITKDNKDQIFQKYYFSFVDSCIEMLPDLEINEIEKNALNKKKLNEIMINNINDITSLHFLNNSNVSLELNEKNIKNYKTHLFNQQYEEINEPNENNVNFIDDKNFIPIGFDLSNSVLVCLSIAILLISFYMIYNYLNQFNPKKSKSKKSKKK